MSPVDILVVDDDIDILDTLAEVLRTEGYQVRCAVNGEQGLRELAIKFPDLVLLDVEMPVLNGPAMAYRMFVHDCGLESIPIVLLTGVADLPAIAAQVGTPYFLEKPYSLERLLTLVERVARERRAPERPSQAAPP